MSEFQPNEQEPIKHILIETPEGGRFECTPDNTTVFRYSDEPQYDMLFIQQQREDDTVDRVCFWREFLPSFDQAVEWMSHHQYLIIEGDIAPDSIKQLYQKHEQKKALQQQPDLAPSEEHHVGFLRYLLEHNLLTPDDFENEDTI